ncbi:MAG: universal stress protein [Thermodesulfobacteriota bacterium]|nr:universal stress protein [Thermodesulfobacteriota bacterium]
MKIFNKILFPVDFSDVSPKIVPWVLAMAAKFDAEVHVLFVARRLEYYSSVYVEYGTINDFQAGVVKGSQMKMEEFVTAHFRKHVQCKTKVDLGDAAEEILKYIDSEKIDLVIIGTHGRKKFEKLLFGSVADKVIKMSPIPVLSINPYRIPLSEADKVMTES